MTVPRSLAAPRAGGDLRWIAAPVMISGSRAAFHEAGRSGRAGEFALPRPAAWVYQMSP